MADTPRETTPRRAAACGDTGRVESASTCSGVPTETGTPSPSAPGRGSSEPGLPGRSAASGTLPAAAVARALAAVIASAGGTDNPSSVRVSSLVGGAPSSGMAAPLSPAGARSAPISPFSSDAGPAAARRSCPGEGTAFGPVFLRLAAAAALARDAAAMRAATARQRVMSGRHSFLSAASSMEQQGSSTASSLPPLPFAAPTPAAGCTGRSRTARYSRMYRFRRSARLCAGTHAVTPASHRASLLSTPFSAKTHMRLRGGVDREGG